MEKNVLLIGILVYPNVTYVCKYLQFIFLEYKTKKHLNIELLPIHHSFLSFRYVPTISTKANASSPSPPALTIHMRKPIHNVMMPFFLAFHLDVFAWNMGEIISLVDVMLCRFYCIHVSFFSLVRFGSALYLLGACALAVVPLTLSG